MLPTAERRPDFNKGKGTVSIGKDRASVFGLISRKEPKNGVASFLKRNAPSRVFLLETTR
ncbi:hypothetical protein TH61_12825 [Rufibacter sp. DG15C]|nr:hypothetical protein TH61_12825 [Rufibacter sp. DG15C]